MKEKGFSLIELLTAVAIVGLLAAIAVPSFQSYRQKSYSAASASDCRHLMLFEQSFFSDFSQYVPITPADKASDGTVSKNVTLSDGSSQPFEIKVLTPEVEVVVNTNANNSVIIAAAHHPGGDLIIAQESDYSGMKSKSFSGTMTTADIPASTNGNDLSSWDNY